MVAKYTKHTVYKKMQILNNCAFICFASFENRCLQSHSALKQCEFIEKHVLFFEEFQSYSAENKNKLFSDMVSYIEIKLKSCNPIDSMDSLLSIFDNYVKLGVKNVIVDVTCFNREILLMIIRIVNEKKSSFENVYFIYNSAEDMNEKFLSSGILDVHSVLGYGGLISPLKKDHMIIMLGFEIDRAKKIIEIYEPDCVTIVIGKESRSINKKLHIKNKETLGQLQASIDIGKYSNLPIKIIEIAIDDALETQRDLNHIIVNYPDHNNIIAPLNTKLSTVGAAFCAIKDPRVQICYSQMALYNFVDYSIPSDEFYVFNIKEQLAQLKQ